MSSDSKVIHGFVRVREGGKQTIYQLDTESQGHFEVPATLVIGSRAIPESEVKELVQALLAVTKFIPQPALVEALQDAMKEVAKNHGITI